MWSIAINVLEAFNENNVDNVDSDDNDNNDGNNGDALLASANDFRNNSR